MLTPSLIVKCTLWATMWLNNGNIKVIEEIEIKAEEETVPTRQLENSQELSIQRYGDFVSISLTRPPTSEEKKTFASFRPGYDIVDIVVARTSGTLNQNDQSDLVELGTKEYFISCKY